jgi:hypothetical protein
MLLWRQNRRVGSGATGDDDDDDSRFTILASCSLALAEVSKRPHGPCICTPSTYVEHLHLLQVEHLHEHLHLLQVDAAVEARVLAVVGGASLVSEAETWLTAPCRIPLLSGDMDCYYVPVNTQAPSHIKLFNDVGFVAMQALVQARSCHLYPSLLRCVCPVLPFPSLPLCLSVKRWMSS